jgi:nuclear transport factor 2 (NTF2) superfamily protein
MPMCISSSDIAVKSNNKLRRNPEKVKMAYTPDSVWRNRDTFLQGRDEIVKFLTGKWAKEDGYRLRKELFAFTDNKVGCFAFPSCASDAYARSGVSGRRG